MQGHRHCTGRPGQSLNPEFLSEPMTSPRIRSSTILLSALALITNQSLCEETQMEIWEGHLATEGHPLPARLKAAAGFSQRY